MQVLQELKGEFWNTDLESKVLEFAGEGHPVRVISGNATMMTMDFIPGRVTVILNQVDEIKEIMQE